MENWKDKLKEKLDKIITSKKLIDYESVVAFFQNQFDLLTEDIKNRDISMVEFRQIEEVTYFTIYNFDLELRKRDKSIDVCRTDPNGNVRLIGEIQFRNGFSYFRSMEDDKSDYLNKVIADNLFQEAYRELWNEEG
ncbi:hypothetical protein [Sporosarcina highlanderae]|uniref:Uncharacterized protein n=1 Tax=Sporosarcina highlanderae TaxID=3035916 RepID=A0ABT8JQC7_9BACL|nr:hypothetical protein [Sporosarcina highlanderae]MDN4607361.1 hypothetical protein [Sporosarcina highlanderae]